MASTGDVFVGTGENNAAIGAEPWSNAGGIVSDNADVATANVSVSSNYLVGRNLDFDSVPTNAIIDGVTVKAEASELASGTEDLNAQLQDASAALIGSSQAQTISGSTPAVYTWGGSADLWGATLTGNMIHDADFGVRFWFVTGHNISVDYVTVAIEYTVPPPGISTETDAALAPGVVRVIPVGMATETDSAFALTPLKIGSVGTSTEPDSSLALSFTKFISVSAASESDSAQSLTVSKAFSVGVSQEADTAAALSVKKIGSVGTSTESDSALAVALTKVVAVGISVEVDTAFDTFPPLFLDVGMATETNRAYSRGAFSGNFLTDEPVRASVGTEIDASVRIATDIEGDALVES